MMIAAATDDEGRFGRDEKYFFLGDSVFGFGLMVSLFFSFSLSLLLVEK